MTLVEENVWEEDDADMAQKIGFESIKGLWFPAPAMQGRLFCLLWELHGNEEHVSTIHRCIELRQERCQTAHV